jgi:Uma2 family endonuclease
MSVSAVGLSWEAFVELPDALLKHAELLDGNVHQTNPEGRPHLLTLTNLIFALGSWAEIHSGEVVHNPHVRIADCWGYRPDLAVADLISQAS